MENKILKFSEYLKIDEEGRKYNEDLLKEKDGYKLNNGYGKDTYTFTLSATRNLNSSILIYPRHNEQLIFLDAEDLEYFKKKYLPKIEEEYQTEINKIKTKYNK